MNAISDILKTPRSDGFPMIRSGLITVHLEIVEGGIQLHGPLRFDEEIVAETGLWSYAVDASDRDAVADAICDAYQSEYAAWCARKEAEAHMQALLTPARHRTVASGMHTPCPALWAGR